MHPILADQVAAELRGRRLAVAEARRRLQAAEGRRPVPPARWRARPARWLFALARRLDPGVDGARRGGGVASVR